MKQHAPTESIIVQKIMRKLQPLCKVRKRHGTSFGVKGDPDLFGVLPLDHPVWPGRHFELEVKRPGENPTPLQRTRLAEWHAAGALTGVVSSPEEALDILRVGGAWDLRAVLPEHSRVKIHTRLSNGRAYAGEATVIEDATGDEVKVQIKQGDKLTALVIGRAEILKVLSVPKTLAEIFAAEEGGKN